MPKSACNDIIDIGIININPIYRRQIFTEYDVQEGIQKGRYCAAVFEVTNNQEQ